MLQKQKIRREPKKIDSTQSYDNAVSTILRMHVDTEFGTKPLPSSAPPLPPLRNSQTWCELGSSVESDLIYWRLGDDCVHHFQLQRAFNRHLYT